MNAGQPITFFEITTAAAFKLFAEHEADYLLLEVGLGGEFDATNVVPRPVGHVGDEVCPRADRGVRRHLVNERADRLDDLDVATLVPAADVIALADLAFGRDEDERAGVILDIEPVANIRPRAIDRDGLALEGVEDHERDQLFFYILLAVIVFVVSGYGRQRVRMVPSPH